MRSKKEDVSENFFQAAKHGDIHEINRIATLVDKNKLHQMMYRAFHVAARNGHLQIMKRLADLLPDKVQEMIAADSYGIGIGNGEYGAFLNAAMGGHIAIMEWLIIQSPDKIDQMISAGAYSGHSGYLAFHNAAANGHISVMEWLIAKSPDKIKEMISSASYSAFSSAAYNGQLLVIEWLIEKARKNLPPERLQRMLIAGNWRGDDYKAFRNAAENGHISIMKRLTELFPEQIQAMIASDNYGAFVGAAMHGHILVMEWLIEQLPDKIEEMIGTKRNLSFVWSANERNIPVMEWLIEKSPNKETLNLLEAHAIEHEGVKSLAELLKTNTTLHTIKLNNVLLQPTSNMTTDAIFALSETLKTNYTLLELEGIESPEITSYLKRNRAIAPCLKPLSNVHEVYELDLDEINEKIDTLVQLAPELLDEDNPLPDTNYLSENYRLLAAISHLKGAQPNEVIQYLGMPFKNSRLQAIADVAFAEALSVSEAFEIADEDVQKARCQCLAYQYRNEPESPLFKMAIYELTHPGEKFTLDKLDEYPEAAGNLLLSYQTLWGIAQQALESLEDNNIPEAILLRECLKQKEYHRITIKEFFRSPAFLEALKTIYPDHHHVQCLETMLFFKNLNRTYSIPTNLDDVSPIIDKAGVTPKYKKTLQLLLKHKPQLSLQDKINETKETLCCFIDTHDATLSHGL